MIKIDVLIDVICDSIEKDFKNNKVNEFTLDEIKALAELIVARANI